MNLDEKIDFKLEKINIDELSSIPNKVEVTEPRIQGLFSQIFAGAAAIEASGELYKVTLPAGEQLAKVKNNPKAYRGFFHGKNGLGHAEFVKSINPAEMMLLASFVVGQYYMSDISATLNKMSKDIEEIQEFQKEELKARIKSVIISIQKKLQFVKEIKDNDEIRVQNYDALLRNEDEISQLISQVNAMILNITHKNDEDLAAFQKSVMTLSNLQKYQGMLLTVLNKTGQLAIYFSANSISVKQAYYTYNLHYNESERVDILSKEWLLRHEDYFEFDYKSKRVVNHNTIGKLSNKLSNKFNKIPKSKNKNINQFFEKAADKMNYTDLDDDVTFLIENLANIEEESTKLPQENPYDRKVQYIKEGTKLFYIVA